MSITVTVRHIFALLSLVWHRYHFGTIFRKPWGSKHSFHGNISETHIDKRIGAAVFLWWRMKPQKLRGLQLVNTIKRCQYTRGKRGIHISRGIYLISHYESDNKRLLSPSFPFSFFFFLPKAPFGSAWHWVCFCVWAQSQMGNNFQLDFLIYKWMYWSAAAVLIKLQRNNQAQFNLASVSGESGGRHRKVRHV